MLERICKIQYHIKNLCRDYEPYSISINSDGSLRMQSDLANWLRLRHDIKTPGSFVTHHRPGEWSDRYPDTGHLSLYVPEHKIEFTCLYLEGTEVSNELL